MMNSGVSSRLLLLAGGGREDIISHVAWTMTPARPPDDAVAIDSTRHKRAGGTLALYQVVSVWQW